jgi:hypothetical protein
VPVAQAPAPRGDDADDSGDNGSDDDEEEENNDNNCDVNNKHDQEDDLVGMWLVVELYTLMFETGHFQNLLQDVLHALGTYVRPLYDTRRVSKPHRACYYINKCLVWLKWTSCLWG